MKHKKTLVIDSSHMPRSIISSDRAFVISYKGNAEIIDEHDETFQLVNPLLKIKKPSIIKVNKYVNQKYFKVPFSRDNVYKRDNYECVYCGDDNYKTLTLDHVHPTSKGGQNTFENVVTACRKCNGQKADLTLEEWGKSIPNPKRPHFLMLMKSVGEIPESWKKYLFF
jgi:tRNA(Ile)-lysidine synthase TilS/MesJ